MKPKEEESSFNFLGFGMKQSAPKLNKKKTKLENIKNELYKNQVKIYKLNNLDDELAIFKTLSDSGTTSVCPIKTFAKTSLLTKEKLTPNEIKYPNMQNS